MRQLLAASLLIGLGLTSQPAEALWPNAAERTEKELGQDDPAVRRQAAARLGELPRAVQRRLVVTALNDTDVEVRLAAADAALASRLPDAGDRVVSWLSDPERRIRIAACEVLRSRPSARAIGPLGRVLADPDTSVRTAAAYALGASGTKDATLPLLGHLDDNDPRVREAVVEALAQLRDPRSVVPLIGKIQDTRAPVRKNAASALGRLGDSRAVSTLVIALRDNDRQVQAAALEALGDLKAKQAVLSIADLLDERRDVRVAALDALARIGTDEALDKLMDQLSHRDNGPVIEALVRAGSGARGRLRRCLEGQPRRQLSRACAAALGRLGGKGSREAIEGALRRGAVEPAAALRALADLGDSASLPVALELLFDEDARVRRAAVDAVQVSLDPARPDGRAVGPIQRALALAHENSAERRALVALLGLSGSPRAVPLLEPYAKRSDDVALRVIALEALGRVGPAKQDAVLLEALDAELAAVRMAAAIALRRAASQQSAPKLLARLEKAAEQDRQALAIALAGALRRSKNKSHHERALRLVQRTRGSSRDALIEALGYAQSPRVVRGLEQLAQKGSIADRAKVAEALASAGTGQALSRKLLADADGAVRANAVWALGHAGEKRDARAVAKALGDRDVAVAGNAAAALGLLGKRVGAAAVKQPLCGALSDSRSYVRANALAALGLIRARCPDAVARKMLVEDEAEVVREAAASLLKVAGAGAEDQTALERCAREDPSGSVAVACAKDADDLTADAGEPVTVFVVPLGETKPAARAPFALQRADGLMRLGLTDRRGAVFEHAAPRGTLQLAVPAPLAQQ